MAVNIAFIVSFIICPKKNTSPAGFAVASGQHFSFIDVVRLQTKIAVCSRKTDCERMSPLQASFALKRRPH